MRRFHTVLFLGLVAAGCGDTAVSLPTSQDKPGIVDSSPSVSGAGLIGQDGGGADPENGQGGAASQGSGGTGTTAQGGMGGSEQGQGGTESQAGAGGAPQGGSGQGGTEQGQGGSGIDPTPGCDWFGERCTGYTFEACYEGELTAHEECTMNCSAGTGCWGHCRIGDVRCSGGTAQTCVDGQWVDSAQCPFQCVNGACAGSCAPDEAVCAGTSVRTCGSDFEYGAAVPCPTHPFATTTCAGAGICGLAPIACSSGTADCDGNWSCETATSSNLLHCGGCNAACPSRSNATAICSSSSCGFSCNQGFDNCDGNAANGCELPVLSDPLNCGACGRSCYGGTCSNGECDYEFEVVNDFSPALPNIFEFTVDMVVSPTHVYWWTQDRGTSVIRRTPKAGGTAEVLTTFQVQNLPTKDNVLLRDGGFLYWATGDGIYRMPETGGLTPVRISTSVASSLTIKSGKLYWNDSHVVALNDLCQDIPLMRTHVVQACNAFKVVTFFTLDLATLALTSWSTNQYEYGPVLGVVGNELFVAQFRFIGQPNIWDFAVSVRTLDVTTGAPSRIIADGMEREFGQAVFVGDVMSYTGTRASSEIRTAPLIASNPSIANTLVLTGAPIGGSPNYLAVDATHAYFILDQLYRVSLSGGSAEQRFGSLGSSANVAVDDTHVYWTVNVPATGEKAVLRAAK